MTRSLDIDTPYLLDLLRRMIRIDSVIPREQALAELVADELRSFGLEPEWNEVAPGRPNVYASAELGTNERFLTITGHMDTVGVAENWESDPFDPVERGGRLYGLGSADMKAGLACGLTAFKTLVEATGLHGNRGRLGFAATVDEEGHGTGARALLTTQYAGSDAMLLGEPFFGDDGRPVPICMTGKVLYRLTVKGKAAHAFNPELGVNAVEDAGKIVAALDRLNLRSHTELGKGNTSTLKIGGGYREYSVVVPERCEVVITRLTVPGETRRIAVEDMEALVASLNLQSQVSVETAPPYYEPYVLERESAPMAAFEAAFREVLGRAPVIGGRRGITDANIYVAERGIPTVTFGPDGGGLHEANEFVEMATLEPTARIYVETARRYLTHKA
jgi:acetylornithine deacetylase/succinyl-diaminopimelate desuccinylase-like protein